VLRALDTVEDDVTIPVDVKSTMLTNFHTYLVDADWKYMGSTEKDRMVLEHFPVVCLVFALFHICINFYLLALAVWHFWTFKGPQN